MDTANNCRPTVRVTPFGVAHSWPTLLARAAWRTRETPAMSALLAAFAADGELHALWATVSPGNDTPTIHPETVMQWVETAAPVRFVETRPRDSHYYTPNVALPMLYPARLRFATAEDALFSVRAESLNHAADLWAMFVVGEHCHYLGTASAPTDTTYLAHGIWGDPTNIDSETTPKRKGNR